MRSSFSKLTWLKLASVIVLAGYWLVLVNQLHVEWDVNPQYSYGWAVLFLAAYLILQRWSSRPQPAAVADDLWPTALTSLLALLYFPTRLVEGCNPEWRVVSWLLAIEVIGLTLCAIWLWKGWPWVRHFWFPLAFFFVAVPWLRGIEMPVIGALTRANAAATVEMLGLMGYPAIQHGNIIEVATGVVGIDEACSGIRSFQASLMISLFFGELFRLPALRRASCVIAGFAFSFIFNVLRTTLLTWVASTKGIAAIANWHDPAGVTILLACFVGVWLLAWLLRPRGQRTEDRGQKTEDRGQRTVPGSSLPAPEPASASFPHFVFGLAIWLVGVEALTETWYRTHAQHLSPTVDWSVSWPKDSPNFRPLPIPEKVTAFLRFDEGLSGAWQGLDQTHWQLFYFRWSPGTVSVQLVGDHNPSICLPASGRELLSVSDTEPITINQLSMRFRCYEFVENNLPAFVFYTVWEDGAVEQTLPRKVTARDRLIAVRQGHRNPGQRVLEVAIWGIPTRQEAEVALQRQLEKLLVVKLPTAP
jgi:exosortase